MFGLILAATITVAGPSGRTVCTVTPPDYGPGATLETTNLVQGVAWRVKFSGSGERTLRDETWTFDFGEDLRCWPVSHAQGEYVPKMLSTLATMKARPDFAPVAAGIGKMHNYATDYPGTAEAPLVVEGPDFTAALGDAGVLDYARIRFARGAKPGEVKTLLEGAATVRLPYVTPWRYLHVAKDPVALANAQPALMDALNAPSEIADTSWIKPGKVLRVAKLDTEVGKAAVDFVKRNGMQYVELDCGWYGQEHLGDPMKPGLSPERVAKGETFDFFAILNYAKAQDVGVILYVNREPLKKNRDAILDTLAAWGVKGVKYGFVNVGSQEWRAWVTDAIRAAAKRKLLVDIHDEYRLTGIQKTFPNVLTVEGICGNEEMPNAAHDCALPFTRFLDGPGDYTPCWTVNRVKNTLAHQLALPCVYTSGWQFLFWYQRPDQIPEKDPALDFWRELPTSFDETRFLQGRIGESAVVARRKGDTWYLGCINAGEMRTFTVPLDFVGCGKVRLFRDADPTDAKPCAPVVCETLRTDTLTVTAAPNGGWAAIVSVCPSGAAL
ncbi:MAG: glycoside hydrolase family 97 catalytic domain-containing protein [Kiritimatiellia bacterium]